MTRLTTAVTVLALWAAGCNGGDGSEAPAGTTRPADPRVPGSTVPPPPEYDVTPYEGAGTWVDVFDFSPRFTGGEEPTVAPDDIQAMDAVGIRTIYLQAARDETDIPGGIVDPETVARFLEEAHARDMFVVAWYLPRRYDADDVRRLEALRDFRSDGHAFDGVAVDIEFRGDVPDLGERNERLAEFSERVRQSFGDAVVGAIVLPPVLLEVINTDYWAAFPWREIAPSYDVWLPMSYWTLRTESSGYRDAYVYTEETIRRLRANLGEPDAVVHPIGGLGDALEAEDMERFLQAAEEHDAIGASVYDFDTSGPDPLAPLAEVFGS